MPPPIPSLADAIERIECSIETLASDATCAVDSLRRFRRTNTWPRQHNKLRRLLAALVKHEGLTADQCALVG